MSPTLQASVPAAVEDTPAISELLNLRTNVALSELMEFYRPLMLSLVKKELEPALRQKVDASDIVQDACQEVARRFPTIRAKQRWQFWSYLMITVRHKLEDARRRYKLSQSRAVHREMSLEASDCSSRLSSTNVSPIFTLIEQEDYTLLKAIIARLPDEIQQLLRWRFRNNKSYVDIGELVDRSPDDVRILIKRSLAKIRRELEKHAASR